MNLLYVNLGSKAKWTLKTQSLRYNWTVDCGHWLHALVISFKFNDLLNLQMLTWHILVEGEGHSMNGWFKIHKHFLYQPLKNSEMETENK